VTGASGSSDATATVKATPTATLDAIAAGMVGEKPQVSEHAIAAHEAEQAASAGKDKAGNAFNPAIHATNADGTPRTTVAGNYALKRGKKAGNATMVAPKSVKGVVLPGAAPQATVKEQAARLGGAQAANLGIMLLVALGGDEFHPRKDEKVGLDEKRMLEETTGDFFVANDWEDLPPGLALICAWGMFVLPRFTMPKTQTRVQRLKGWLGAKIGAWRANRRGKKRGMPESDIEQRDRESRDARNGDSDRA
jgi:hypothetical protein